MMTQPITNDAVGEAIRNTCILACVRLSKLGLSRTDKQASDKVTTDANAVTGAARVVVHRLPGADDHHKAISGVQTQAKLTLNRFSMAYGNDAPWRLLPNENWDKLVPELGTIKSRFDALVQKFKDDLPNVLSRAHANKGDLNVDLPTEAELLDAYHLETEFRPLNEGRFKGLPDAVARKLEQHAQAKLVAAVELAKQDTLQRFVKPLEDFVDRMHAYDLREAAVAKGDNVGRNGVFRDSVVGNIIDLLGVLGPLDVLGDERLIVLADKVQALNVKPGDLRDSKQLRQDTSQAARAILNDLKEWL